MENNLESRINNFADKFNCSNFYNSKINSVAPTISNFSKKWVDQVEVSFLEKDKDFILIVQNVYKIRFKLENRVVEVERFHKDFKSLRDMLRKLLPCVYIYPLIPEKIFVG